MTISEYHTTTSNVIDSLHEMISRIRNNYKAGYLTAAEAGKEIEKIVDNYSVVLNNLIVLLDN